jgi:hypothetical protein
MLVLYPLYRLTSFVGKEQKEVDKLFENPLTRLEDAKGDGSQQYMETVSKLFKQLVPQSPENLTIECNRIHDFTDRMAAATRNLNEAQTDFNVEKQVLENAAAKYDNFRNSADVESILKIAEMFFSEQVKTSAIYEAITTDTTPRILELVQRIVKQDYEEVSEKIKIQAETITKTYNNINNVLDNTNEALIMVDINSFMIPNIEAMSGAIIVMAQALAAVPELVVTTNLGALLTDITHSTNGTANLVREIGSTNIPASIKNSLRESEIVAGIRANLINMNHALDTTTTSMHSIFDPMRFKMAAFHPAKETEYNYANMSI